MIGHVSPEAAVGGPIALIEEGDIVSVDVDAKELNLEVADDVLAARRAGGRRRPPRYTTGGWRSTRRSSARRRRSRHTTAPQLTI